MSKGSWKEFGQDQVKPKVATFAGDLVPLNTNKVRVQKTKAGRGGKVVTIITGLDLSSPKARELLKTLKATCGTGGTIKNDVLELQGDQVNVAMDVLKKKGLASKKSGT